jgi:curved DNA-binding protein CbpA
MDKTKNYYRILGVLPTAELIVIKAAYRALAMKYHPDQWTGDRATAERKIREINEAFEVLSNERVRSNHSLKTAGITDYVCTRRAAPADIPSRRA